MSDWSFFGSVTKADGTVLKVAVVLPADNADDVNIEVTGEVIKEFLNGLGATQVQDWQQARP